MILNDLHSFTLVQGNSSEGSTVHEALSGRLTTPPHSSSVVATLLYAAASSSKIEHNRTPDL